MILRKIARTLLPKEWVEVIKKNITDRDDKATRIKKKKEDEETDRKQKEWLQSEFHILPPVPPKKLQERVSGAYYWKFFSHGLNMLHDIDKALEPHQQSIYKFSKILDFGCGCGRFLIPLSLKMDPAKLYGCDIDKKAITWFQNNYPNLGGLYTNPHRPPTNYPDDFFDFVYSVSIFTHLPEDMQFEWLGELKRITKKNGWLVLTVHGTKFMNEIPEKFHALLKDKGFYYHKETEKTKGLPDFYKGAYHQHPYIQKEWSKYFRVVSMLDQGIGAHQDLILLQKVSD